METSQVNLPVKIALLLLVFNHWVANYATQYFSLYSIQSATCRTIRESPLQRNYIHFFVGVGLSCPIVFNGYQPRAGRLRHSRLYLMSIADDRRSSLQLNTCRDRIVCVLQMLM